VPVKLNKISIRGDTYDFLVRLQGFFQMKYGVQYSLADVVAEVLCDYEPEGMALKKTPFQVRRNPLSGGKKMP